MSSAKSNPQVAIEQQGNLLVEKVAELDTELQTFVEMAGSFVNIATHEALQEDFHMLESQFENVGENEERLAQKCNMLTVEKNMLKFMGVSQLADYVKSKSMTGTCTSLFSKYLYTCFFFGDVSGLLLYMFAA